jgi:hypothetical protein
MDLAPLVRDLPLFRTEYDQMSRLANNQGLNMVIRRLPNLPNRFFPRNIPPNNPLSPNDAFEGIDR